MISLVFCQATLLINVPLITAGECWWLGIFHFLSRHFGQVIVGIVLILEGMLGFSSKLCYIERSVVVLCLGCFKQSCNKSLASCRIYEGFRAQSYISHPNKNLWVLLRFIVFMILGLSIWYRGRQRFYGRNRPELYFRTGLMMLVACIQSF